jgi:transposase
LGRTRGELSTKVHLCCDGKGRPLSVVVTPGQRNDGTQLFAVLDAIRVPRAGRGRPRQRPEHLLADRGYGKGLYRRMLRALSIPHTIPERKDHRERREGRPGQPLLFDAELYARHNVVERCVNRLKQWRAIATRYEKRAVNYRAMVMIASLMIWLAT